MHLLFALIRWGSAIARNPIALPISSQPAFPQRRMREAKRVLNGVRGRMGLIGRFASKADGLAACRLPGFRRRQFLRLTDPPKSRSVSTSNPRGSEPCWRYAPARTTSGLRGRWRRKRQCRSLPDGLGRSRRREWSSGKQRETYHAEHRHSRRQHRSGPETRTTNGGTDITHFTLATSRPRYSEGRVIRDVNGYRVQDTEWHRITAFNGLGKTIQQHCEKG